MNIINNLEPQQNSHNFPSEHIPSHIDQQDSHFGQNFILTASCCCFEGNEPTRDTVMRSSGQRVTGASVVMAIWWCPATATAASTVQVYSRGQPAICQPNIIHYTTVPFQKNE